MVAAARHQGRVVRRSEDEDGVFHLHVAGPVELAQTFTAPGQYQLLGVAGEQAYFAIASAVAKPRFEYFIRTRGGVSRALSELRPGDSVAMSEPLGNGFPLSAARGRTLLLVGSGTGVASLRSAVLSLLEERAAYGRVVLLAGTTSERHLGYCKEFREWERAGIEVMLTLSSPSPSWTGRRGLVQDHLPALDGEAVAFLCGHDAMIASVEGALTAMGVPRDRVFTND